MTALRDDIKANGLRDRSSREGQSSTGGIDIAPARLRAYKIPAKMFRVFNPKTEGDPLKWVISKNLKRRHLNETQRAWIASKIANAETRPARDRRQVAQIALTVSRRRDAERVIVRTVKRATAVRNNKNITPELLAAVEQGKISINLAKQAADLPAAEQREIAARAVEGDTTHRQEGGQETLHVRDASASLPRNSGRCRTAKFGVILAAPEWLFKTFSEDGKGSTAAENHYPTSAIEDIKKRAVEKIAAADCRFISMGNCTNGRSANRRAEGVGLQVHHQHHLAEAEEARRIRLLVL